MSAPAALLSTKFYIPPVREDGVLRPRLTQRLQAGLSRPRSLALLAGPAGFGKTTLLAEFAAQPGPGIAWLSLDESDNDPARFWTYLIAACRRAQPEMGAAALALLASPAAPSDEALPTLLINELSDSGQALTLILDDLHAITNPAIHTGLAFLLEQAPDNLHVAAATRVDPPWPLARWRARNRLIEIRAADLRFTPDEAATFLYRAAGLELAAQDAAVLEARIEGWAAGLQLAAASLAGRGDVAGFLQAFSGSHTYVAEYLVEEALQRQAAAQQEFLLQTAVLERLNAELCQAVTGRAESRQLLADLRRANLFLLPLDDAGCWFRYHTLFAELLRAHLRQRFSAADIAGLHRRAASWYAAANLPGEAIEHALAAHDLALAAGLIEQAALGTILQGHVRTVEGWLQALPEATIFERPRLMMACAWMRLLQGMGAPAAPYLQRLGELFESATQDPPAGDPALRAEWLALQAKAALLHARPQESRARGEQALACRPAPDPAVRSLILLNLASAHAQMLDYERAAEMFAAIAGDARAAGDFVAESLGVSAQAQMLLQLGRLGRAHAAAQAGVERLEAVGQVTPFAATLYGELGQIHYYRGQFDAAQAYFQRSVEVSRRSGFSDSEIYHHVAQSRICLARGDWDAAAQAIEAAVELARRTPPAMVREEIITQQARVHLAGDRADAAQALLAAEGFSFGDEPRFPGLAAQDGEAPQPVMHPAGLLYNSALLLLAHIGQSRAALQAAIALAGRVLDGELRCQHLPVALETLLARSRLRGAAGDELGARDDLAQALALGAAEGFVSPFLEAGAETAVGLARLLQHGRPRAVPRAYASAILAAFSPAAQDELTAQPPDHAGGAGGDEEPAPIEELTRRELEVLELIAAGSSNAEIAARLVVSVSAVKKHSANIYAKLNVSSRTQAVARARRLGWIA